MSKASRERAARLAQYESMKNWGGDLDPMTWDSKGFDPYSPARSIRGLDFRMAGGYITPSAVRGRADSTRGIGWNYDPSDVSEAGYKKTQDAWAAAAGAAAGARGDYDVPARAVARNLVWQDYAAATKQYYNLKQAASNLEAQTKQVQRKATDAQREAMRKTQEGGEEGFDPKNKAIVRTGSNIPVKTSRRTSQVTPIAKAGRTARFKSPGINI